MLEVEMWPFTFTFLFRSRFRKRQMSRRGAKAIG